ncbi:glycosyltransferase [Abyssalbus ytuae]|uniref:Glycosyltransferase n=1 Tax=Abyssalbus ytuae TaxID=2926907 RepID=A0A9E7D4L1_9FLAO|nr:glycosyltransferase [Abyssalbus ytuae]UOB19059.1 glycosyltransferase [Abyssalbus ytuae]
MRIGIVVPCYNEEKRLNVELFVKFIKTRENYHVCFVNDGSKDDTLLMLEHIKREVPLTTSILDIKKNKGKRAAIRVGARYLFSSENVDYIGYMNARSFSDFNDFDDVVSEVENSFNSQNKIASGNDLKRGRFKNLFFDMLKKNVSNALKWRLEFINKPQIQFVSTDS